MTRAQTTAAREPSLLKQEDLWLAHEVDVARVGFLYQKAPVALLTVVINSSLLVWLFIETLPRALLFGWWASLMVITVVRFGGLMAYARRHGQKEPVLWERWFMLGSGLNGLVWGFGGSAFMTAELSLQVIVAFVIGGMVAGASSSTSTSMPSFLAFSGPAALPMIGRLALAGEQVSVVMAAMLLLGFVAMTLLARQGGRAIVESVRLRLKNELLVSELERRSRARSGRLRLLLEQAGVVMIVADPETLQIVDVSENAAALFDTPVDVLAAMRLPELEPFPALSSELTWTTAIERAFGHEVIMSGAHELHGQAIWLEMSLTVRAVYDETYALLVFKDVTARRQLEAQRSRAPSKPVETS